MIAALPTERRNAATVLASGELRYSSVWEDHLLLEEALTPHAGDDLLVITSAGDNVLNLLLREPRRIVAIDVNPAQSALLELKVAAIANLEHEEFTRLLGITAGRGTARVALYERIRRRLSDASRAWWDTRTGVIESGIAQAGRLEAYIAGFRDMHLSGASERAGIDQLLASRRLNEQRVHASRVLSPEFEAAFSAYFTAESLGARGRDPSQMQFVNADLDVSAQLLARLRWVCTELPVAGNHYLERFFRGEAMSPSPYLHADSFVRLRSLVSRVAIVTGEVGEYVDLCASRSLSHAALSDMFEYLSEDATAQTIDRLTRVLRVGGRIAYWNLFVPRTGTARCPRLGFLESLSRKLWSRDRSWFYRAFRIEEVVA